MPKERPRSPIITKVIPEKRPPGFNGHPKGAQRTQRDASAAQRDAGVDKGVPKGPQRSPQRRHEVSTGSPKEPQWAPKAAQRDTQESGNHQNICGETAAE